MAFDKTGMSQPGFKRAQHRIESLDMADLENQSVLRREFRQLGGVLRIFGDWFFHQKMFATPQKWKRDLVVRVRWRRDRCGIDQLRKFVERFRDRRTKLSRDRIRAGQIDIVNRGELGRWNFCIKPGMTASDMADADHANAKLSHLAMFFRNQA